MVPKCLLLSPQQLITGSYLENLPKQNILKNVKFHLRWGVATLLPYHQAGGPSFIGLMTEWFWKFVWLQTRRNHLHRSVYV
jgi:hypothetical protein